MSVSTQQPAANVPQLFLPGQAAAPEGPVQAMPMYLMHHAFRRDLAAFAAAVPLTPLESAYPASSTITGAWSEAPLPLRSCRSITAPVTRFASAGEASTKSIRIPSRRGKRSWV